MSYQRTQRPFQSKGKRTRDGGACRQGSLQRPVPSAHLGKFFQDQGGTVDTTTLAILPASHLRQIFPQKGPGSKKSGSKLRVSGAKGEGGCGTESRGGPHLLGSCGQAGPAGSAQIPSRCHSRNSTTWSAVTRGSMQTRHGENDNHTQQGPRVLPPPVK